MDSLRDEISPYRHFERNAWAKLRADTPMTLDQADIDELRGLNDRIDLAEVVAIYLPLSRLLNLYVAATQELFRRGRISLVIALAFLGASLALSDLIRNVGGGGFAAVVGKGVMIGGWVILRRQRT